MNAYCINLDSKKKRWEQSMVEFKREGLVVSRFPAIANPKHPRSGCLASHRAIIKKEAETGSVSTAIFEDDVVFIAKPDHNFHFLELPEDWDLLSYGSIPGTFELYSEHLVRIVSAKKAHAMIFSCRVYDTIINAKNKSFDRMLNDSVYPRGKSFCVNPVIAIQRGFDEDIARFNSHVSGLKK